jgi:hypothetical protein
MLDTENLNIPENPNAISRVKMTINIPNFEVFHLLCKIIRFFATDPEILVTSRFNKSSITLVVSPIKRKLHKLN